MDVSHPVAIKMFELGCSNQAKILLAFQTYIELCEAYALRDVDYEYNKDLDLIFIRTKDANGKTNIYVPTSVSDSVSLALISQWNQHLIGENKDVELFAAVKDACTTGVYYKITQGLAAPLSLDAAQVKKSLQDAKDFARMEIIKARNRLYQEAMETKSVSESSDITQI